MSSAYEKMLKSGDAFKEVDISMDENPNLLEAQGIGKKSENTPEIQERNDDYTDFDNYMEKRVQKLKSKISNGNEHPINESNEISKLKNRIKKLEEVIKIIMNTHIKLIEGE